MYCISSIQMAHPAWFNAEPTVLKSEAPIAPERATDARAVARELLEQSAVAGEITDAKVTPNGFHVRVVRPGAVHDVEYLRATNVAVIQTATAGFVFMLNRIHHIAGVDHEYVPLNIWGAFVLVVSISLMLLAGTGVYLWFKLHQERMIGAVLLTLCLGYSLTVIALIRFA